MGSKFSLTICNQSADVVCLWHWDMQVGISTVFIAARFAGTAGLMTSDPK